MAIGKLHQTKCKTCGLARFLSFGGYWPTAFELFFLSTKIENQRAQPHSRSRFSLAEFFTLNLFDLKVKRMEKARKKTHTTKMVPLIGLQQNIGESKAFGGPT